VSEPKTQVEWQRAVDAAAGLRAVADCKMYGLLEGGPEINVARCDQILELGAAIQVYPSRSIKDLAIAAIAMLNLEGRKP
jgi:hypothetical protein